MNLLRARVLLRTRTPSEVFELAILFQRTLAVRTFPGLWLRFMLPSLVACIGLRWAAGLAWHWVWLCALVLARLLSAPFTAACGRLMFEEDTRVPDVLEQVRSRAGALFSAQLRSTVEIGLAGLLVILAPRVWGARAHLPEIVLLEGLSGGPGRRRAQRLFGLDKSRAVRLGFTTLCLLAGGAVFADVMVGAVVGDLLQMGSGLGTLLDGGTLSALVGFHLVQPFAATLRYLSYVDLRTRADGWDVQVRLQALARRREAA